EPSYEDNSPLGKEIDPKPADNNRFGNADTPKKADIGNMQSGAPGGVVIQNPYIAHERTGQGVSYFFRTPPQGIELGWDPVIFLGVDDGSGVNLPAIMQKGGEMQQQLDGQIRQYQEGLLVASDNQKGVE